MYRRLSRVGDEKTEKMRLCPSARLSPAAFDAVADCAMGGFLLILTYAAFVSIFAQVWPALPSECVSLLPPAPPARAAAAARAGGSGAQNP